MLNFTIFVTDSYINSPLFSVQEDHIIAYVKGELGSIQLQDWNKNILASYAGDELKRVMISALKNGRRSAPKNGGYSYYYLADR